MEKLALVLPDGPPYVPRKFGRCVVIGNYGDILKTKFGKEVDSYDAVLRENGAPIQVQKVRSAFSIGAPQKLLIKLQSCMEIPILNPVYLMLGSSFGSAAKGIGLKALEFALSICDTVDMYGFTVDLGYKEWTRYFSESRQCHTPLHGRAYYQMMECLGVYGNGLIKSEGLKRGLQNMESSDYEKLATMKELENQLPEDEDDPIGQNDVFAQIISIN
ncbi:sialyltransferase-like protein 2 isoform X3 [Primulina eburnea]|uniref:sialyltransferase-like protein 2 isoform X2 n=1 Tax=Primulina eburnea TaxID=1245227 RepID=UPI003C6C3097